LGVESFSYKVELQDAKQVGLAAALLQALQKAC
jgi:hypothetical protein